MSLILNPIQQYFDLDGSPLASGYIYFGEPNSNPVTSPIAVFYDAQLTQPAAQPIRTVNGYPVRAGTATGIFAQKDASILVQNVKREQVIYIQNTSINTSDGFVQRNATNNTELTPDDSGKSFIGTGTYTQTLNSAVSLGSDWAVNYANLGTGVITFDPNLSELIDGLSSLRLEKNKQLTIKCTGTGFLTTISDYPSVAVASASTLDLRGVASNTVTVTGTTGITSILLNPGQEKRLIFADACLITNSSSLILDGNANYTTATNDVVTVSLKTDGNVRGEITRANGQAIVITDKIQPITASVAGNALTMTLNPTVLDFRSSTLSSGTVNTRSISSAISMTVSSGSTLGTVSGQLSRLVLIAIDNAGTIELACVNLAGGNDLSETGLISTTAEGGAGAADSATVIYSTTARTNVPYRVIGYIESTQTVAGTWAANPSLIQGYGGQALAAMSSLGYGQTWQNVTGSRVSGTTYYNTKGKPIQILCYGTTSAGGAGVLTASVNGSVVNVNAVYGNGPGYSPSISFIVPCGFSYSITYSGSGGGSITNWSELS